MAHNNSPEGLLKHGYTLKGVKEWRTREHEAGCPSGLDDFFRIHGLCFECYGNGRLVIGARWRDRDDIERSEEGPVAQLAREHNLDGQVKVAHG